MFSGKNIVAVDSPVGRLGLTVCYDLRFPELYQQLRFQHEAQVQVNFFFSIMDELISLLCWLLASYFVGSISTFNFHSGNRSGTLGDSSSCSCN